MKDCSSVIQSILKKLKEKPPLNFNLVRNAACLVPLNIIQNKNISVSKFGKLVTSLYECSPVNAEEADQSKDQFLDLVILKQRKVLKSFLSMIWLMTIWTSSLDNGFFELRSTHHSEK